jgi:hypothetical protein
MNAAPAGDGTDERLFDLNIEEVLDHWDVEHALREIIANALDEQLLTATADVEIFEDPAGAWHVRDHGRGLQIEHFTLNENKEKLSYERGIIGKFGVGLKDALATFHRRGVAVTVRSRHGTFRLREAHKHNFDAISTLHVEFEPGSNGPGTDFELHGVSAADIIAAKSLFLRFNSDPVIETTDYGQVLECTNGAARVYITGVLASEEPNFVFSYNITSLTSAMKKRLNRERLNVGRTTYAERVKSILRSAKSEEVCDALAQQVAARGLGTQCDEMQWIEISQRALNLLHQRNRVSFVTENEMYQAPDIVDQMRRDGYDVVLIDDAQKSRLDQQYQAGDSDLRTMEGFIAEFNDSFSYQFVPDEQLDDAERRTFDRWPEILALVGIGPDQAPEIKVSETMRVGLDTTNGVWDPSLPAIVIKRSQLPSLADFAGTLLHEAAHATTGAQDVTRYFESVLTDYLGRTSERGVNVPVRNVPSVPSPAATYVSSGAIGSTPGREPSTASPDSVPAGRSASRVPAATTMSLEERAQVDRVKALLLEHQQGSVDREELLDLTLGSAGILRSHTEGELGRLRALFEQYWHQGINLAQLSSSAALHQ